MSRIDDLIENAIGNWLENEQNETGELQTYFMGSNKELEFELKLDNESLKTVKEIEARTPRLSVIMTSKMVENKDRRIEFLKANNAVEIANNFASEIVAFNVSMLLIQLNSLKKSKELNTLLEMYLEELEGEGELDGERRTHEDIILDALDLEINVNIPVVEYWDLESLAEIKD